MFLCRCHHDAIHSSILEEEFTCLELPPRKFHAGQNQSNDQYADWLGCTERQDFEDCLTAFEPLGVVNVVACVVDHYGIGIDWESSFAVRFPRAVLMALDDLANRSHSVSWLVDSNRLSANSGNYYRGLISSKCNILAGAYFALLSRDYPLIAPSIPTRICLKRILVFFGGVDSGNMTAVALEALQFEKFCDLEVDIVLGHGATHLEDIQRFVDGRANMNLHICMPSLSGLMIRADLAIGAGGTASWERACLGLPSLIVPIAENQIEGARELQKFGAARCLVSPTKSSLIEEIREEILALMKSSQRLEEMSLACVSLGDGRGVQRSVMCLLGHEKQICLRPAEASDVWIYYWWVCDPDVRSQSFNDSAIALTDHQSWFQRCMNSQDIAMYVLVDGSELPLGQIRFEGLGTDSRVKISFSLDRLARRRGLASLLLSLGLKKLRQCRDGKLIVFGRVKKDNVASAKAFLRTGFCELASCDPLVREFELLVPVYL